MHEKREKQWKLFQKAPVIEEDQITILSWNVLADRLCYKQKLKNKPNNRWLKIEDQYLKWDFRREKIFEIFQLVDPDIICLQEMDAEHYVNEIKERMEKMGYSSVFQSEKEKLKEWGNCIFFKTAKLQLCHTNSRSRTLIVGLKVLPRSPTNGKEEVGAENSSAEVEKIINVCNVHLEGTPSKNKERFNQLRSSLDLLQRFQQDLVTIVRPKKNQKSKKSAKKESKQQEGEAGEGEGKEQVKIEEREEKVDPVQEEERRKVEEQRLKEKYKFYTFVVGDFNTGSESGIYKVLREGFLPATYRDPYFVNSAYTDKDYQSSFKFESAYKRCLGEEVPFTFNNLHNYFFTIDFLFYETRSVDCLAVSNHFDPSQQSDIKRRVLSDKIPSDHYPVSAIFRLKEFF